MRVQVSPDRFRWARERAGLSAESLAKRFPTLEDWENGAKQPTLKQLETFAKATHAPVGFFFLPEPPVETVPIPDFRTVADLGVQRPSPDLLDTLYICQQRQDWYRDFARVEGEDPLPFVGSLSIRTPIVEAANSIRGELHFSVTERASMPTWSEALRRFIEQADSVGVLVMVSGVVGNNNYRKLEPTEFRGFALADQYAPLVFVNGSDSRAAQMFTLAHELAHIWLGQSALSDAGAQSLPTNVVESWCNRVAGELLVPSESLRNLAGGDPEALATNLARVFKVSKLVIFRRLRDVGAIAEVDYWRAYHAEIERLAALPAGNGGNFYLTQGARLSKRFARAMVVSTFEGRSTFTEAFRLLGVTKMSTLQQLGTSLGVG